LQLICLEIPSIILMDFLFSHKKVTALFDQILISSCESKKKPSQDFQTNQLDSKH